VSASRLGDPRRRWRELGALLFLVGTLLVLAAAPGRAQDASTQLRQQREQLERIRLERAQLERQAQELRSNVHDLAAEVENLDRRADASARLVATLDAQIRTINGEVERATRNVTQAETELKSKRGTLRRRMADIYKRGPMYTVEALLSARSFGELVARYKYLHLLALRDRALVDRVEQLRNQVTRERDRLTSLKRAVEQNREDKAMEEERLRGLERERSASLALVQRDARAAEIKLDRLRRTETQLADAITALEAERRRAESSRAGGARGASSIRNSDYGNLDWPVSGPLVYDFGKTQTASNTTIRWNGVGIRANVGTPVHAVAAGKVVSVRQLGTYGLTVIIDHGGGDYSIYGSLARAEVNEQQTVAKGETIGAVGISDPDLPPHLHFEIRQNGGPAVDPAEWLRRER
jgi:septal ring factor EnvC (AmiA/AmiB activator)